MVSLILGAGGMLGRSVARTLAHRGEATVGTRAIDWTSRESFSAALRAGLESCEDAGGSVATVYWCAGAGHVAAERGTLAVETELIERLMAELTGWVARSRIGDWNLVFASSAGAAWAGVRSFPVSESTPPRAVHAYGEAKLAQEAIISTAARGTSVRVLIARISNLYGPLQDTHKPQGLLSHLVVNSLHHRPTHIFVPLDTIRDYIPSSVAADMLHGMACEIADAPRGSVQVRLVASERPASIATILGLLGRILKRHVPVTLGERPEGRAQPRVLTFRTEYPSQAHRVRVTLEEGLHDLVQHRVGVAPSK